MSRRLLVVAIFLVIGAVLNLAIAWISAATIDIGEGEVLELYTRLGEGHHWEVFRWDRAGGTRIMSRSWQGPAPSPCNDGDPAHLLAGWGTIRAPDPGTAVHAAQIDEAWGFPMRTMACRSDSAYDGGRTANVIRLPESGLSGGYLPTEPIWTGFAINTLFYALLSMVAYGIVRDATCAIRRRAR